MKARRFSLLNSQKTQSNPIAPDLKLVTAHSIRLDEFTEAQQRSLRLDALRGLAVVLMIGFHLLLDLRNFRVPSALPQIDSVPKWFWVYAPEGIGILFYLAAGASAWFKFQRNSSAYFSFARAGLKLAFFALSISVVTAIAAPQFTVYFGTLHCLSLSMFLIHPFLKSFGRLVPLGLVLTVIGVYINQLRLESGWLLWLGPAPRTGTGGDWYPLLPWFGVILIGAGLAKSSAENFLKSTQSSFAQWNITWGLSPLAWIGRHALLIYLLHQIALIGVLTLLGLIQLR